MSNLTLGDLKDLIQNLEKIYSKADKDPIKAVQVPNSVLVILIELQRKLK
jgi:hypothetical protein